MGGRADEGDADPLAQLGERGILGDEPHPTQAASAPHSRSARSSSAWSM